MPDDRKIDDYYEHAQQLIEQFGPRDDLYDRLDKLYDQEQGDSAAADPENAQIVRMPYGTNAIDLISDLAAGMELTVTVPAAKETATAKREADDLEAWLLAWQRLNEKAQHTNLTADAAWFGAQRACVVARMLYDRNLIEKTEDGGYKPKTVPVLLQLPDPRNVYWEEGPGGLETVVEARVRLAGEIRRYHPKALDDRDKYPSSAEIEWVEYWNKTDRVYYADGEPVAVGGRNLIKHRYGCVPYAIGMARSTPRKQPAKRFRPLLRGVFSLLANIDIWYSILTTAGWDSVTNAWAVFSDHFGGSAEKELSLEPDAINYLAPDDKVQALQRVPLPPDFFALGGRFMEAFEQGTFPFALYGQLPGQMAGYAINMLTSSGRRPLVPIWQGVQRAYEGAFAGVLQICREVVAPLVGDEIPLLVQATSEKQEMQGRKVRRSLVLDVSKFGEDFSCDVELSDPMPQDEAGNVRMALETTAGDNPLLSHETALEKFKLVTDALAESDRIQIERIVAKLAEFEAMKLAVSRGYVPKQAVNVQSPPPQQQPQMPPGMLPESASMAPMAQPEPNAAELQALAGQPQQVPGLDQMAGMPPVLPGVPIG